MTGHDVLNGDGAADLSLQFDPAPKALIHDAIYRLLVLGQEILTQYYDI